ncbi:MAG: RecX family transcriptional regulator [Eubacteriales bacterium]|nr:RecX family transcriptional regulator [Eubacteriales bacterium]
MTENKKPSSLYERAVVYILSMPRTEKQMRQWYARKTKDQALIDADIARLVEYGLINDEAYAQMYVEAKKNKMGVGMIRNKLRWNGVKNELVENAVDEVEEQHDFALSCVEKYMRTKEKTPENKSKLFRWLLGKGIVYDTAVEVIDEFWR